MFMKMIKEETADLQSPIAAVNLPLHLIKFRRKKRAQWKARASPRLIRLITDGEVWMKRIPLPSLSALFYQHH